MRLSATLAVLSCIGLLGGCMNPRALVPGQSTEADVSAKMGKPTDNRVDRNGDRLWEYATGPEGTQTFLVRIGTDGKVKEVIQLLTEEQFGKIVPGTTTKPEVRSLLGRPSEENEHPTGLAWSWRILRTGIQPGHMVVRFNPDNTVFEKIIIIDPSGDSRDQ
jgi:hypothetical protein